MHFTPLAMMEQYISSTVSHRVALADYAVGIHSTPHVFFKKEDDGSVAWVISRRCEHAGGTLRVCDGDGSKAVCPLHNWEFDFNTLRYSAMPNQVFEQLQKPLLPYHVVGDELIYEIHHYSLRIPAAHAPIQVTDCAADVRFITHASLMLTMDGINVLTDPWFEGECLACGWWLKQPPKADAWELLAKADILYMSHNHPDHLHAPTLARARRDIPIIVPQFDTDSVAKPLRDLGFTNVIALEKSRLYRLDGTDLLVSILPTSDHREDSALFVCKGNFSAVLTVDCVGANQYVLPSEVTFLGTNFASGASGWPLCYDVVGSMDERSKIVTKNRGNAQVEVLKYLAATKARAYMPYAGYFDEAAPRDAQIRKYNVKNTPDAILDRVRAKFPDVLAINPLVNDMVTWRNGALSCSRVDLPPLFTYDAAMISHYLDAQQALLKHFNIHAVADYFCQSEFQDSLIVYLVLSDDAYVPNGESLRIDFSTTPIRYEVVDGATLVAEFEALEELGDYHHLLINARRDSMWQIVYHGRPLEELSLGFQCRIDRKPDQYNAAFWKHYTTYGAPMLRRGEDRLLDKLLDGAMN